MVTTREEDEDEDEEDFVVTGFGVDAAVRIECGTEVLTFAEPEDVEDDEDVSIMIPTVDLRDGIDKDFVIDSRAVVGSDTCADAGVDVDNIEDAVNSGDVDVDIDVVISDGIDKSRKGAGVDKWNEIG